MVKKQWNRRLLVVPLAGGPGLCGAKVIAALLWGPDRRKARVRGSLKQWVVRVRVGAGRPCHRLPVTRLTMLSDAQRRAHQQRADAAKVLCQPIEAVRVPRQLARDCGAARHALRARRLENLGARVARQCGPGAALPPQRDLGRNQAGSAFGHAAGAPETSFCARSRLGLPRAPASLGQPLAGGAVGDHIRALFSTSRLTLSISTSGVASSLSLSLSLPPPPPPSSPSSSRLLTRLNSSLPCRCAQSSTVFSPTWLGKGAVW